MIDKDKMIKVKNRDTGSVGYTIPDLNNLHRHFVPQEEKEVPFEELKKLAWTIGGEFILKNCLVIEDEEAAKELIGSTEPEYNYSDEDVKNLLLKGSLDELLDCLDFAPNGVIELVKKYAVELEVNDISKRNAILKSTGFNVTKAIEINHLTEENQEQDNNKKQRRVAVNETKIEEKTPTRRTKYKVVD